MKRVRHVCLVWHRYAGLFMAVFLAIAGLTASILAFRQQIDRMSGELSFVGAGPGDHLGNRITVWLRLLHRAKVNGAFYWPYRLFVFALGFVITMLSVTGVYIWWKKRSVRKGREKQAFATAEGGS
ncbi:MAG: PepSY-associated TM helix domain-containing protein [Vicinamibacterales bacterium]